MVEGSKVPKPSAPLSRPAPKRRGLPIERILVTLIVLWAVVVFGLLLVATIVANSHATDLLPTGVPTP